jgi:hypothetical protein
MSTAFRYGDKVLWWPSNVPAYLFKGYAETIAQTYKIKSGLGDMADDECEVDVPAFEGFVAAVSSSYEEATHPIIRSLLFSFIPTAQVLLERAGRDVPRAESGEQEAIWAALRQEHAHSMSR